MKRLLSLLVEDRVDSVCVVSTLSGTIAAEAVSGGAEFTPPGTAVQQASRSKAGLGRKNHFPFVSHSHLPWKKKPPSRQEPQRAPRTIKGPEYLCSVPCNFSDLLE